MTIQRLLSAAVFLMVGVAHAQSGLQLLRVEGQPVYCTADDRSRSHRELPEHDAGVSARDKSEILHMKLVRHGWSMVGGERHFALTVRLQIMSCLRDEEGLRYKHFETPDDKDWAQAHVASGLFSGEIFKSNFRRVIYLDQDSSEDENVYHAQFLIPESKLFTKRQYRRFKDLKSAETSVQLTYHYERASSEVRPPFVFEKDEKRFPGTFSLELYFDDGKLVRTVQGIR